MVVPRTGKSWNQMGHHFLQLKMLLVFCLLMKSKCKLLFRSITLLFQILSIITQHSVWLRLYLQSIILFLSTDFYSKQENIYGKNDAIKIKSIYKYILNNWFSSKWKNIDSKNDAIKIRKIIYIYFNQLIFFQMGK